MIQIVSIVFPMICFLAYLYFGRGDLSKEKYVTLGIAFFVSILFGFGLPPLSIIGAASYSEIWNYKNVKVQYYEDWDERVSCNHARYRTEYYTTTDSKGRTTTQSRQVFDGYEHAYDVDYHPERWMAVNEFGGSHSIDKDTYNGWKSNWKNSKFVDMNRSYHTDDGDMYESVWPGSFDLIYPESTIKTYSNKVRASNSVFNYQKPSEELQKKYPRPSDEKMITSLYYGLSPDPIEIWRLQQLNADLGPTKQVCVIIVNFNADSFGMEEVEQIKSAWQGPNKNELVVCVGRTPSGDIKWCDVFSWMDDTTCHAKIRQFILSIKKYDRESVLQNIKENVNKYWNRKQFKDFDYINIETPTWCYVVCFIITFLSSFVAIIICDMEPWS